MSTKVLGSIKANGGLYAVKRVDTDHHDGHKNEEDDEETENEAGGEQLVTLENSSLRQGTVLRCREFENGCSLVGSLGKHRRGTSEEDEVLDGLGEHGVKVFEESGG